MTPDPSRRAVLLGGLLGGGSALLAGCAPGRAEHRAPAAPEHRRANGRLTSVAMEGAAVGWTIAYPPGHAPGDRLPVVVTLHGRGATHATAFSTLHLDRVLADVVAAGVQPFALASVDGGDHGYWHPRADGTDPGAMVADEFIPLLRRHGLDTDRLGLHGWSMGGYGALLLAGRHQVAVRAVAVASPALFSSSGNTPPGAFDDAADYLRNDVYGHPGRLDGVPLRVDCGQSDPFYVATRAFVDRLEHRPAASFGPGRHDAAYWRKVAPAELRFLGSHLR
jgi:S-formylglutathione hydrolase FrmB